MRWLALFAQAIDKIPFERLLVRPPDNRKNMQEVVKILQQSNPKEAETKPENNEEYLETTEAPPQRGNLGNTKPKIHLESNKAVTSEVSTKETVDYQNREIGKVLLTLQRHCVQKFRINGKACDCGQSRHLLELEALVEEVMAMVENTDIYGRILDWVGRLGPICTIENVSSGKYDDLYPGFGNEARDMRKELLGTLDPQALFPEKHTVEIEEALSTEEDRKDLLFKGFIT